MFFRLQIVDKLFFLSLEHNLTDLQVSPEMMKLQKRPKMYKNKLFNGSCKMLIKEQRFSAAKKIYN